LVGELLGDASVGLVSSHPILDCPLLGLLEAEFEALDPPSTVSLPLTTVTSPNASPLPIALPVRAIVAVPDVDLTSRLNGRHSRTR
jgi:hypothetical protein